VLETVLQQMREDLQQQEQPLAQIDKKRQLTAAEALLSDDAAGG
jgi:hypothetical protein